MENERWKTTGNQREKAQAKREQSNPQESTSEANGRVSMLTCVTQVNIIPIMG